MPEPFIPPVSQKPGNGEQSASQAAALMEALGKLAGKTTIDEKMTFEVDLLAHVALSAALRRIADRVYHCLGNGECAELTKGKKLIFLDTRVAAALESVELFDAQCLILRNAFVEAKEIAERGLAAAGQIQAEGIPETAAAAAVSLLGVLKEDVVYSGRSVKIEESTIAAELGRFVQGRLTFLWPSLFITDRCSKDKDGKTNQPQSVVQLNDVMGFRQRAAEAINGLTGLIRSMADTDEMMSLARALQDQARLQFDSADVILRQFSLASLQTNEKTGLTSLGAVELGYKVRSHLISGTHLIWVRVAAAGGSYRMRTGLLPSLLGKGLSYSGGVVLAYALLNHCGEVVISGEAYHFEPYTQFFSLGRWLRNLWSFPYGEEKS